jgi:Zn-finger nucleic acid-binding protein
VEVSLMKCPVDGATLAMGERHGVEIDYCPECRGIWLDRGELDRIIERANGDGLLSSVRADVEGRHDHDDDQGRREDRTKRKGRFSMLTDLLGGGED